MSDYLSHTLEYFRARIEGLESQLSQAQAREEAAFRDAFWRGVTWMGGSHTREDLRCDTNMEWTEYLAQRGDKPVTCMWISHRHGYYETGCKSASEDNPYRQQVTPYCHLCGRPVEVAQRDTEATPPCETCKCVGNKSCGHEPVNARRGCALSESGDCYCCLAKRDTQKGGEA